MKKIHWKKFIKGGLALLWGILFFATLVPMRVLAQESRTVRVAFFPMEGFHTYSETDGYGGMDVAYLEELCSYTGWNIEYN